MTDPKDIQIPEEILRSERKQASPPRNANLGSLGMPGLPPAIIDLLVRYGPVLVLAAGAFGALNAVVMFFGQPLASSSGLALPSAFLGLAASIAMLLAYVWLKQKRRIGWNTLALALIAQFLSQILVTGVGSMLFAGVEVMFAMYVMLQLRDSYSG